MSTAVIILNYNGSTDTIACIKSVELYNTSDVKYIIVDNGSTKANDVEEINKYLKETFSDLLITYEDEEIPAVLPYVTFFISRRNDGYAAGNNKGLTLAYSDDSIDDVLILNSDILFIEDIIPVLKNKRSVLPDCGIISPILYKKDLNGIDYNCARRNHNEWNLILTYLFLYRDVFGIISKNEEDRKIFISNPELLDEDILPIELPSGSCMLISKDLIREIGGLDPNTFLYFEENILYKKLNELGKTNYMLPKSKCIHLGATSTQRVSSSFLLKCSLDSSAYYLKKYCRLGIVQKIIWSIAKSLFSVKIKLVDLLK